MSDGDKIHPQDVRYHDALERNYELFGIRWENVLLPTQWQVCEVDGQAEVVVNAEGFRILAMMAPDQEAGRQAVEYIDNKIANNPHFGGKA